MAVISICWLSVFKCNFSYKNPDECFVSFCFTHFL